MGDNMEDWLKKCGPEPNENTPHDSSMFLSKTIISGGFFGW